AADDDYAGGPARGLDRVRSGGGRCGRGDHRDRPRPASWRRGRSRPDPVTRSGPAVNGPGENGPRKERTQGSSMAEDTHRGTTEPVLVIIPTYNERDNLAPLLRRLHEHVPDAGVLVVDDGSPDGTGDLADEIAADDEHVHVLHRTEKAGLGAAYIAGFRWGLERDYATLVEMDADGSHAPEDLPRLLAALDESDLVIGSRYVPGGALVNWPKRREVLSRG